MITIDEMFNYDVSIPSPTSPSQLADAIRNIIDGKINNVEFSDGCGVHMQNGRVHLYLRPFIQQIRSDIIPDTIPVIVSI